MTIALQLPAVHWFYFYIIWFVPFAAVAFLGHLAGDEVAVPVVAEASRVSVPVSEPPVLVGV